MMRETVEAVVIGFGAGGGCAAKVLACAGIKTLVLERGEWAKGDVLGEDDLASQRSPCLCLGSGPGGSRTRKCHYHDNGDFGVVSPLNAACVGSGTTPSLDSLTQNNKYNRYTLVIAVAKCARKVTDEYVAQREEAERMLANKETDKSLSALIKKDYRDEKAVRIGINRLSNGEYVIDDSSVQ